MPNLWLPDFLRRNWGARAGLGVLLPPGVKDLDPDQYLGQWEEKAEQLLQQREEEQPGAVRLDLQSLDPDLELHDLSGDSLRLALGNLHSSLGGLGKLLQYLRKPDQESKQNLLDLYPPEGPALSPQEELKEQKELSLVEFLQSL